ncbi:peptidoglycan L,D-transpeptidase lipoprotein, YkuD family, TPR domain-containing [Citrifermentans bemidjiense Bem]|uniref:Peptidoglycan L,D-transpeptidase lipoprotein, YkuD family, TPR domain-containing n=1 Tax=Citrifermentans bemidjiense (strain ATCC BAA-1014 / DSM 16622 / JCM 12645 / Bem) TaxID=404380 RepID=B5EG69_CITBB|nr:L,D-transpeptidase family protein [Citrifermentans bemidjiense]ACH40982.2 peptidoglycan L,D-transpeptidase lipoprotein, YkuD family, TPR domain-containing [Citrifermentans bemidjiense Bem]
MGEGMREVRRVSRNWEQLCLFVVLATILFTAGGCSHLDGTFGAGSAFEEANRHSVLRDYQAALKGYELASKKYPTTGDRALFEMGIIHSHPDNPQKDYGKALDCYRTLIKEYPRSSYRQDSEMMVFYLVNVTIKDKLIDSQRNEIEVLQREVQNQRQEARALQLEIEKKVGEIAVLQQEIAAQEEEISPPPVPTGPADKVLIEKKERRLTLLSKGEVIKSYKISLGENPNGPKERQGDNKTPEGIYRIDSRNNDSQYHLSLHISYPNEQDKKRAKQLGVAPGGNIMIHGMRNGFSWFGEHHTLIDWTKGCIAVTDEEIQEIAELVPIGTVVEIMP